MRYICLLSALMLYPILSCAQIEEKIYIDIFDMKTDIVDAARINYYSYTDTSKMEYHMREYDFEEVLHKGIYKLRYLKGTLKLFSGVDTTFYRDGNIKSVINYHDSKFHGELLSYYENGQLRRKELYKQDSLISSICYTSEGADTTYFPYIVQAEYPGGTAKLSTYIQKNINYPYEALKNGIEGTVVIGFIVEENGSISNFKVLKSPDQLLSEEALRILKAMPEWTPGQMEGQPERMIIRAPIKFKVSR